MDGQTQIGLLQRYCSLPNAAMLTRDKNMLVFPQAGPDDGLKTLTTKNSHVVAVNYSPTT